MYRLYNYIIILRTRTSTHNRANTKLFLAAARSN